MKKLILILSLVFSSSVFASDEYYRELVMGIYQNHMSAIQLLSTTEMKYSDNVGLHILALDKASGLLGNCDRIQLFRSEVRKLRMLSKNEKDITEQLQVVRNTCTGCHQAK